VGFERIKEEYESCPDFGEIVYVLKEGVTPKIDGFILQDNYLFWFRKLCVLCTFLRGYLVWELHAESFAGHIGWEKIIEAVESLFNWPGLKERRCKANKQCRTCQL